MSVLVVNRHKPGYRELRCLVLALVLHALLLLVSVEKPPSGSMRESARLVLRLMSERSSPAPPLRAEVDHAAPEPQPRVVPLPIPEAPEAVEAMQVPAPSPPTGSEHSLESVSAAGLVALRDSVTEHIPMDADKPASSLRLGAPKPFARPDNWLPLAGAKALAPFDNVFNGTTAPADVEVVDRWSAADGSQNVIVATPNGLRLCGRASAWDPARPLVEHVMHWQVCGGDFARAFKIKPRERLDRDSLISVAKDATTP